MPQPTSKSKLARDIAAAMAVAGVALLLQWMLQPWIGSRLPFVIIEPAIIFAAATLGRLPASLVMLVGAVNAAMTFQPTGQWLVNDPADRLSIVAYLAVGALLVAFGGRLHLRSQRAERAERAERRLAFAQDETGVGLFELDYSANTAYASPALCQILGQPVMEGSMPLSQWLDALNAGHVAESRRTLQQKVSTGELRYERELHVELPDGTPRWLLSRIRLDLDARGQLAAARGATLDITARKQLVTELEAAQSQLRQQLDDLGRLHGLSNRLLAMPLLDGALQTILETVGAFHDTPFGSIRLCEPDGGLHLQVHCGLEADAAAQLASLDEPQGQGSVCSHAARSGGRVVVDLEQDGRFDGLLPLARSLDVRQVHSTPLIGSGGGGVLGVLTVLMTSAGQPDERLLRLTDLCAAQAAALIEREQALRLAQEAQRRFEVALQSSSAAFTVLAPVRNAVGEVTDFAWTYANPAASAMLGRTAEGLIGQRVLDVLPHGWAEPGYFERFVQVCEQGCTAELETQAHRPGHPKWLHVILSPLNGSVVVWFTDITQRREQQQALQDADRRKDQFVATLAHELRNPLAPIRNATAIVRDPATTEQQRLWSLGVIERQLQHMALMLDDLLDVSRISRGTLALRRARHALQAVVDTAVETARPLLDARQHRLLLNLPDHSVWLDVDPLRIAQVLGNLLVNAAKFTDPGGQVTLSALVDASEVVVSVSDNGKGLRPEDCERVFEMFAQVSSGDGLQSGLGIGLALARSLVHLHGGRLYATSPGLGLGCSFVLHLPLAASIDTVAADPAPVTVGAQPAVIARRRILIADDNRDAADSLAILLELDGHNVKVAYDGGEALARYHDFKPQVALLDMGMPTHTGAEVARLIRLRQQEEPITLVAITGFGQERDRKLALEAGFDHHITKPVRLDHLQALINRAAAVPG